MPTKNHGPLMSEEHNTGEAQFRRLIDAGAEISGGALGSALGFLAAGPAGAAAGGAGGAAAAAVLKHVGGEVSARLLSHREQVRVGGVLALVASEVEKRLAKGEKLHDDAFFNSETNGRSSADEISESILLKSQREPEERKLPYMAHLLANIAFDDSINLYLAEQLTKAAEQLSYRQLCLLRIGAIRERLQLRSSSYKKHEPFTRDVLQVLYECYDLSIRGYVSTGGSPAFGPDDIVPAEMNPQGIGGELHNLMRLFLIPDDDLLSIASVLR